MNRRRRENFPLFYQNFFIIVKAIMNTKQIKIIFFDLDNTLFDHTRAERNAILALMGANPEIFQAIDPAEFVQVYHEVNKGLWKKMAAGEITSAELKRLRFQMSLENFNGDATHAESLSKQYFEFYSGQNCSLPDVHEVLDYLQPKYQLGILSNGFPEIQETKLRNLRVGSYFKFRIYSGEVGAMKPSPEIFRAAMKRAQARADEIAFVGDSYEDDVVGASAVGWQTIFLNTNSVRHDGRADFEISGLLELRAIV